MTIFFFSRGYYLWQSTTWKVAIHLEVGPSKKETAVTVFGNSERVYEFHF